MMSRRSMMLALALTALARASMAQVEGCTYDTCALRLHRGFWGPRIVRGVMGEKVAGYGMFAPRLSLFAQRSDSAARYYELFRKSNNQGNGLMLAGSVIFLAAVISAAPDWNQPVTTAQGVGLTIGTGFIFAGLIRLLPSHNRLSKAIWWYNRSFTAGGGP